MISLVRIGLVYFYTQTEKAYTFQRGIFCISLLRYTGIEPERLSIHEHALDFPLHLVHMI